MFWEYLPVFVMLLVAIAVAVGLFVLTSSVGPKKMTPEKAIPYEGGSETTGAAGLRLSVKFFLTAILFVVFDIEAIFLYPWAGLFRRLGFLGLAEMLVFLTVLGVTLAYVWKKGAFEWEK